MNPQYSPESIYSSFINQIKDYAIFATDTKGVITTWNTGVQRLKGYSEDEFVGHFYGMLHPDDYQEAGTPQRELELALQNGSYDAEDWRKRKDGSLFWATITLTPIFDDQGQHIGYTKITGDITKQKELQDKLAERQESALERKNEELHKINVDLDNFIYTASHDLRSPITNIEALMTLLKDELTEANCFNDETQDVVQRVINSINRFKRTLEDLTEISRLQKNANDNSTLDILSVKEVYEEIMADLVYPSEVNNCIIRTDFQVRDIKFSRKNFRSILYNLISNAIKYQSPERECSINISTRLEKDFVVLSVKDLGLGLNTSNKEQLYTMFKRFHDHVPGTGVGLYMVKKIVDNAGGKIEVESEPGTGTEFKVYLKADL